MKGLANKSKITWPHLQVQGGHSEGSWCGLSSRSTLKRLCRTLEDACRLPNYSNVKPRSNLLCCAQCTLFCVVNTCCMQAIRSKSGVGTWLWYLQIICCIFCLPIYFRPCVYQFCCPDADLCPQLLWHSTCGVLLAGRKLREE